MHWLPVLLVAALGSAHAQQTAQTRVADELSECYRDPNLVNRNNLPPVTLPVLIDIIRKIEDNPNVNMDLRQLSTVLLHTYVIFSKLIFLQQFVRYITYLNDVILALLMLKNHLEIYVYDFK